MICNYYNNGHSLLFSFYFNSCNHPLPTGQGIDFTQPQLEIAVTAISSSYNIAEGFGILQASIQNLSHMLLSISQLS